MNKHGFALPTVLITSVAMMIVLLAALTSVSSISSSITNQYYNKLGRLSSESGVAMAVTCMQENDGVTWTPSSPLKPDTQCNGSGTPGYLFNQGNIRTSFSVSPTSVTATTIVFAVTSKVELLRASSGQPRKEYTSSVNFVFKYSKFDIASGNDATCATVSGQVWCWGDNANGGAGTGEISNGEPTPKQVTIGAIAGKYAYSASTGLSHTCALAGTTSTPTANDSKVYCWGINNKGQMGNGIVSSDTDRQLIPIQGASALASKLPTLNYTGLSASNGNCVIAADTSANSRVWCWGQNDKGQAIDTTSDSRPDPTVTTSAITSNASSAFTALRYNTSTTNSATDSTSTSAILNTATKIAGASSDFSCALTTVYTMYCWGSNTTGQLGIGTVTETNVHRPWRARLVGSTLSNPTSSSYRFTTMSTNLSKMCAIGRTSSTVTVTGKIYCWGANGNGGGIDYRMSSSITTAEVGTPTNIVSSGTYSSATFSDVQISDWGGCAIRSDGANVGKVYCWGYQAYGALGNGTTSSYIPSSGTTPSTANKPVSPINMVQVGGPLTGKNVVRIVGGNHHFCAMTATGATYCWGRNDRGQVGDGTTIDRSIPVRTKVPFSYTIY